MDINEQKTFELTNNLLEKSQEAFITGLELYNKPTIRYRVEGFSFFICNAWELMLKAHLIQRNGEDSVYYSNDKTRTISLINCIEKIFTNKKDPLRMNLEQVIALRNTSTHFITVEYEQIYVPFFQSCVLNYSNKMLEFFKIDITKNIPTNFLTLSINLSTIDPQEIQARYSEPIANRLLKNMKKATKSIPTEGNSKYAILIKHELHITKKADLASASISISKDAENAAFILKETKDMQRACPHRRINCIELINKTIKADNIAFVNPSKQPNDEKYRIFTTYHFDLIVNFYQMKSNPSYCYRYDRNTTPLFTYSEAAINFIVNEIKKDPEHIIQSLKDKKKS